MSVSKHEERMIKLQYQMRENNQDLQDYLKDLESWESDVRHKEEQLTQTQKNKELPPVRNSLQKKKLKKKKKPKDEAQKDKPKKIPGYDYRAWDKFDIDKALEEAGEDEKQSSSEYETDEEWEKERNKHLATQEKEKGNELLKKGELELAVECYTRGMALDPTNVLLPANRAMALLKQGKYGAAEVDCTSALALDPLYIKAYLRRASARSALGRYPEAQADYRSVLKLEPHNKPAQAELDKLEKEIARSKETPKEMTTIETEGAIVKPIHKPVEMRSKKPLRRITIEEIGVEEKDSVRESIARTKAAQGDTAKQVSARDQEDFNRLLGASGPRPAANGHSHPPAASAPSAMSPASVTSLVNHSSPAPAPAPAPATAPAPAPAPAAAAAKQKIRITEVDSEETTAPPGPLQNGKETPRSGSARPAPSKASSAGAGRAQGPSRAREGGGDGKDSATAAEDKAAPSTSFQFQADYRELKGNVPAFFHYFKRINPSQLPHLFGSCLESAPLMTIFTAIQQCYIPEGEDYLPLLQCLPKVKRFSTTIMFLSSKEKQVVKDIFSHLKKSGASQGEVDKLCKLYDVL